MAHGYRITGLAASAEERKKVADQINIQKVEAAPLVSMNFYIHPKTDILDKNGTESFKDWNSIASTKIAMPREITIMRNNFDGGAATENITVHDKSPLEIKILQSEPIPVSMVNITKVFGKSWNKHDNQKLIDEAEVELMQKDMTDDEMISYLTDGIQYDITKKNPYHHIVDDMRSKGIEAHLLNNPDMVDINHNNDVIIYTPNIYQNNAKVAEFVKYFIDNDLLTKTQVKNAPGFEQFKNHFSEMEITPAAELRSMMKVLPLGKTGTDRAPGE